MTDTIQAAASEAAQWFETARRPHPLEEGEEGERFTRTKDGAPEWVSEMVREAHGGMFPDDWRYECISDALDWIAETGESEEGHEFADGKVDVYTSGRLAWLASDLERANYVDEAAREFGGWTDGEYGRGGGEPIGVLDLIGQGQYAEAMEVFALVAKSLEARADDLASEDVPA